MRIKLALSLLGLLKKSQLQDIRNEQVRHSPLRRNEVSDAPTKQMTFFQQSLVVFILSFTACSPSNKNSDGTGGLLPNSGDNTNLNCNNVFTNEAIFSYNEKQNLFRIRGTGYTVHCFSEINNNGKVTKIEKNGFSDIEILPSFKFISSQQQANANSFILKFEQLNITIEDQKEILKNFSFELKEGEALPITNNGYATYPSYARIGKASLFYLTKSTSSSNESGSLEVSFKLTATNETENLLFERMAEFTNTKTPLEILWSPKSNLMFRQVIDNNLNLQSTWSNLEAHDALRSLVKEGATRASLQTLDAALDHAIFWDCDIKKLHIVAPELYFYADSNWQNPSFADNTISKLITELKYLLKVNPEHNKKDLLNKYEILNKYLSSNKEALTLAFAIFKGELYTQEQFEQIAAAAEVVYPSLSGNSWKYAEIILKNYQFDIVKSNYAVNLSRELLTRGFIASNSALLTIANKVYEKISAGLDSSLKDIYFKVFDLFKSEFSKSLSEHTCDEWVLTHKVTEANLQLVSEFIHWAKDTAYVYFDDSFKVIDSLIKAENLSQTKISLFKTSYQWLVDSIYINRSEAFQLCNEMLNDKAMTAEQFNNLKELTNWFINSIYLNRRDALTKTQTFIFDRKINSEQTQLIKNITTWLINSIYLNRTEAANKAENYLFTNTQKMDQTTFTQFKDLTDWYINSIYINRNAALADSERLILTKALTPAQTDVMKQAVNWLINSVYLNRSEAKAKGETYVVDQKLDAALLSLVQAEFESLINRGKSRTEALNAAETKYL